MNIKEQLLEIVKESLTMAIKDGELPNIDYPKVKIEYPREAKFGDYAIPFALESAKIVRKSPLTIGEILKKYIEKYEIIGQVDVVKPGFINIFISFHQLIEITKSAVKEKDSYGRRIKKNPLKYNVEFVSANPTGPMNIVSARAAAIGDTIANLIEANGDFVDREFYVNDYGNQVNLLGESVLLRLREIEGEEVILPENGYHGNYVKDIAAYIQDKYKADIDNIDIEKDKITFCAQKAVEYNVSRQKKDLEDFGVYFNKWFEEHILHETGKVRQTQIILEESGYVYEQDGKKFFKSTNFGDDKDRVVVRDDGRPTYLMADIAYHNDKINRGYDKLIDLWGPDHHGYIARLSGAVQALGNEQEKFRVLIVQQVNLIMEGELVKMSKRLGNFSTMRELIEEVGVDVSRYFFIMRSLDSHLDFDLALATKNSSENPVFYLQYAHARICSIFKATAEKKIEYIPTKIVQEFLNNDEAENLMKLIMKFPEEICDAAENFEPHRIANFLMKLAQSFHRFYTEHRILTDNLDNAQTYLVLVDAVRIILRNGLYILGVSAPETM